ncbi:MAG: N-acetyltransferase [Rhizobiales bacterium]|jgi:predicted N-acetyltransferase YhbS|nr:N-acetyltransferase [Hyphomicrobiales bacterium]
MITIDSEKLFDIPQREMLLDQSFGPSRGLKTCERLREGRLPSRGLAFVARGNDQVLGTIRLWDVAVGTRPLLMLGPLAVSPACRGIGLGSDLMVHALAQARRLGHRAIFLVGDAPYYNRFGFHEKAAEGLDLPGPFARERLLALEIEPGALSGVSGMVRPTGPVPLRPENGEAARGFRAVA